MRYLVLDDGKGEFYLLLNDGTGFWKKVSRIQCVDKWCIKCCSKKRVHPISWGLNKFDKRIQLTPT